MATALLVPGPTLILSVLGVPYKTTKLCILVEEER